MSHRAIITAIGEKNFTTFATNGDIMNSIHPPFPAYRSRRLRKNAAIRNLVREHRISPADLIWPIFVEEGSNTRIPIRTMPGIERLSIDMAVRAAETAESLGIPVIALFPRVDDGKKTVGCEEAWNPESLVNRAARTLKAQFPNLLIMLDVALDPYNSDGHDGLYRNGEILNDETLRCLEKQALSHAEAGADILGPSDMMDGRIGVIRQALERQGFPDTAILSYSAKFASAFYGPFRDAVGSTGALKGGKHTYQVDPANSDEAVRMAGRDLAEGADMVMIKPGLPYLDICYRVKKQFGVPTFAYQVSGEYAMITAAAQAGSLDAETAILESLVAFKRAGCDGVLTYFAPRAAKILSKEF